MTDQADLWQWPPVRASAPPPLLDSKEASADTYDLVYEPSMETILDAFSEVYRTWDAELSPGIYKLAALRDEGEEELPPVTRENIWRHPNAHPVTLTLLLLDKYGNEMLGWDPEVLRETLRKDSVRISNSVYTKILAARPLLTTGQPWRRWEAFHAVAIGLSGNTPNFVYLEQLEVGHAAAAVDVMTLMDKGRPFADEVDTYLTGIFKEEGIPYAPLPLDFINDTLRGDKMECTNCGLEDRWDDDVRCIYCGKDTIKLKPGDYTEHARKTAQLFDKYRKVELQDAADALPDTLEGNAAYKLLVHWRHRDKVRAQLMDQIRRLAHGS